METGINHNIDELLVGIVTQIRLKQAGQEGDRRTVNQSLSSHMVSQWSGSTYNHTIVMLSGFIEDLKTIKNLYEQVDL